MAASSLAPHPARVRAPAVVRAPAARPSRPRQPLILWAPVVTAVIGSFVLIAVVFAIVPHHRHALSAPLEDPATEQIAGAQPELIPAPAVVVAVAETSATPAALDPDVTEPTMVVRNPTSPGPNPLLNPPGANGKTSLCQQYGTKVDFYDSPALANRHAVEEQKLVFVLHVAGNFEEPGFT